MIQDNFCAIGRLRDEFHFDHLYLKKHMELCRAEPFFSSSYLLHILRSMIFRFVFAFCSRSFFTNSKEFFVGFKWVSIFTLDYCTEKAFVSKSNEITHVHRFSFQSKLYDCTNDIFGGFCCLLQLYKKNPNIWILSPVNRSNVANPNILHLKSCNWFFAIFPMVYVVHRMTFYGES